VTQPYRGRTHGLSGLDLDSPTPARSLAWTDPSQHSGQRAGQPTRQRARPGEDAQQGGWSTDLLHTCATHWLAVQPTCERVA
jgi:hypothetical protein